MKKYLLIPIGILAIYACEPHTKEVQASPAFVTNDTNQEAIVQADSVNPNAGEQTSAKTTSQKNTSVEKGAELIADNTPRKTNSDEGVRNLPTPPPANNIKPQPTTIAATQKVAVSKEYLLGKFDYRTHPDFTKIDAKYTGKPDIYLRKEAYTAFQQMYEAAKKEGVSLRIISATRNFNDQKAIWERKWTGDYAKYKEGAERCLAILSFSSMPSTSRHHWGTDMDLNDLNDAYFQKGEGKKVYEWLMAHAGEYGFCNVYSSKANGRTGYNEEKWHWSYTPLSSSFTQQYAQQITYSDITGFKGAESAKDIQVIQNYVQGINPMCK